MARLAREMDGKHARPRACSPPHGAVYSQHNDGASARGSARAWLFCDPRMPCHLRTCAFALVSPSYRRRDTERVARTAASLRACEARRHAHVHVHDPHPVHPAHPLSARMQRLSVSSRLIAVPYPTSMLLPLHTTTTTRVRCAPFLCTPHSIHPVRPCSGSRQRGWGRVHATPVVPRCGLFYGCGRRGAYSCTAAALQPQWRTASKRQQATAGRPDEFYM